MSRPLPPSRILLLCCALGAPAFGQSRWEDLSSGMDEQQVSSVLGQPLIVHGSRGYIQWTFDAGGSVMFHQGKVAFWGTPKGHKPAAKPRLMTVFNEPIPGHEPPTVAPDATTPAPRTVPESTPTRPAVDTPSLISPTTAAPAANSQPRPQEHAKPRSFAEIVRS